MNEECGCGIVPCPLTYPGEIEDESPATALLHFPPRTIPFRSASFSQVDVTADGKYIQRNPTPTSPITLRPSAFCLSTSSSDVRISHGHSKSCPVEVKPTLPSVVNFNKAPPLSAIGAESVDMSSDQDQEEEQVTFVLGGDDEKVLDHPLTLLSEDARGAKATLIRQSSSQSDSTSDEPLKCPASGNSSRRGSQSLTSTLKLGSSGDSSSSDSGKASTSAPSSSTLSPNSGDAFGRGRNNSTGISNRKELISRAVSINSALSGTARNLPSGRFYKRPLRGPYGEMLEAEMNKLIPSRALEEPVDFYRDSKSSSPTPTGGACSDGGKEVLTGNSKLGSSNSLSMSSLLQGSMDDLELSTKQNMKHVAANARARKVSTNIPLLGSYGQCSGSLAFHQRTASSPSEFRYSTVPDLRRGQLDGSPRGHVLAEIVETERSYVESLRIIIKNYMEPLKDSDLMEDGLVDEIFFQIPTIMWHHERLLEALQKRLVDDQQSVGDVMLDAFRPNSLMECYALFVRNWKNAKGALKMALAAKPSLGAFLEANARQHKGKLNLDALLIMPIQRIPRLELLFKELLKYTPPVHDDHSRLVVVLEKIREFAIFIDCASIDRADTREIEIEGWNGGVGHLVRHDILPVSLSTPSNRKERAVFLFADSILIASIKRKGVRKTPLSGNPSGTTGWEGCKFKMVLKAGLGDVKLVKEDVGRAAKGTPTPEADDLRTLHRILELSSSLNCPHGNLDEALKDILAATKGVEESLELTLKAPEGSESSPDWIKLIFSSMEKKSSWIETFSDTLSKYMRYGGGKCAQVQFLLAVPIRKTRAGLLLSAAAPVSLHNKMRQNDVWVANSDGYVGQICILNLFPEPPSITSCNSVCNSKIICMTAVPPPDQAQHPTHASSEPPQPPDEEEETQRPKTGHKEHWSVWLGTEDGGLHVYDCADSIRVKKNRHKIQLKAPVRSIAYFEERVFTALGNGDVVVYIRNSQGKGWATGNPSWVTLNASMAPVTKMVPIGHEMWCACGSELKVYGNNSGMLELVQTVGTIEEGDHPYKVITDLVHCDGWVWVATKGSSVLKAFHAETFEPLHEVNVTPQVTKILGGCDEIIRQHKIACLRITSLTTSPTNSTIWIGTSAGVILTLSPANSLHSKITPLSHGHTGQVRFLTSCMSRETWTVISGGDGYEEFRPLPSSTPVYGGSGTSFAVSLVTSLIGDSGGDASGREDSTNHLLIWKIHKRP